MCSPLLPRGEKKGIQPFFSPGIVRLDAACQAKSQKHRGEELKCKKRLLALPSCAPLYRLTCAYASSRHCCDAIFSCSLGVKSKCNTCTVSPLGQVGNVLSSGSAHRHKHCNIHHEVYPRPCGRRSYSLRRTCAPRGHSPACAHYGHIFRDFLKSCEKFWILLILHILAYFHLEIIRIISIMRSCDTCF